MFSFFLWIFKRKVQQWFFCFVFLLTIFFQFFTVLSKRTTFIIREVSHCSVCGSVVHTYVLRSPSHSHGIVVLSKWLTKRNPVCSLRTILQGCIAFRCTRRTPIWPKSKTNFVWFTFKLSSNSSWILYLLTFVMFNTHKLKLVSILLLNSICFHVLTSPCSTSFCNTIISCLGLHWLHLPPSVPLSAKQFILFSVSIL